MSRQNVSLIAGDKGSARETNERRENGNETVEATAREAREDFAGAGFDVSGCGDDDGASTGRVDDVDALAGMLSAYVLAHVAPLLAARAAVGTLESRCLTTLVSHVPPKTLEDGVTVATLGTYVITPDVPSTSYRDAARALADVGFHRVVRLDPVTTVQISNGTPH